MPTTIEGLDKLIKALETGGEVIVTVTMSNLISLGNQTKEFAKDELDDVRYTGALESSFVVEPDRAKLQVQIYPTAEHAMFVRMGTRPHWAPIGPLREWAAVKLGDEKLGYPVQRSIAREGTSVFQLRKRGTKANPWPARTVTRGDFIAALAATERQLGAEIVARLIE